MAKNSQSPIPAAAPAELEETVRGPVVPSPAPTPLLPVENQLPLLYAEEGEDIDAPGGFEEFGAEELVTPRLMLQQPMSEGTPGTFRNQNGEEFRSVTVTFVNFQHARVRFARPFVRDQQPLCRSDDARVGIVTATGETLLCVTCPFSQWGPDGSRPECDKGYAFVGIHHETGDTPFVMNFRGTSVAVAKGLLTAARFNHPTELRRSRFRLTAHEEKNDQGKYWVPDAELLRDYPRTVTREAYEEEMNRYKKVAAVSKMMLSRSSRTEGLDAGEAVFLSPGPDTIPTPANSSDDLF